MTKAPTRDRAVAIGGSAGSIAALEQLLGGVPADFPAPIFVVVHIGARGGGALADILDRASPLPVETARDGEHVEGGRIYVAPPDRHLLVIDDAVRLGRGPRENMSRPALDPLFRSVAMRYSSGAVGVVLSGTLDDGSSGLAAIKRCGGRAVVQNPSDAAAAEMPLSALQAADVDDRAGAAQIGPLLHSLLALPLLAAPPVPAEIALEVEIAHGRPSTTPTVARIGDPSPLSCPDCGGVLSEIRGDPLRFRCQIGHAYAAGSLGDEMDRSLEAALGVAMRIVEGQATLLERMAREAQASGRALTEQDFRQRAAELREQEDLLRTAALRSASSKRG